MAYYDRITYKDTAVPGRRLRQGYALEQRNEGKDQAVCGEQHASGMSFQGNEKPDLCEVFLKRSQMIIRVDYE